MAGWTVSLTLGLSEGMDEGCPLTGNGGLRGSRNGPAVLVGLALGWMDGIPLTLGLSDSIDVGLPVLAGLILGCLGDVETLGLADGTDDRDVNGDSEGSDWASARWVRRGCKDGSVDNEGCVEVEGDSDGRLVLEN